MKKICLTLSCLICFGILSYGKTVSVSTAKTIGYNFLHQTTGAVSSADELNLVYTSGTAPAYFYVFNGANCFVIVAADDNALPILGYSGENTFGTKNIPAHILDFLSVYNSEIDFAISKNVTPAASTTAEWENLSNAVNTRSGARTTWGTPLLGSIKWDQYPYYNADCPVDAGAGTFGGRDVTGCVATAMAQVMKYWSWPTTGVGTHSYSSSSYGTLSATFGSTTYNWAAMPNSVTSASPAVATLMYDAGVSVDMNYTATESSAYVIDAACPIGYSNAEEALKNYFNYVSTLHGEVRAGYADATWISMLKTEIDANRPVIYYGTGTSGGHCFVFDDYDASSNFHVNWGWSGVSNGYFPIDALDPSALGAGGGGGGFDADQGAIFGIKPNSGGVVTPVLDSIYLADYVTPSASSIPYYSPFTVTANPGNVSHSVTFNGDFGILAFDASGTFICVVDSQRIPTDIPALPPLSDYVPDLTFSTTGLVSMVPGNYTLGFFYRNPGSSWVAVSTDPTMPYSNFVAFSVYNDNPLSLYTPMSPSPSPMVTGSAASITLKVENLASTACDDSLYLGLYNLDGSGNSDIQAMAPVALSAGGHSGTLTFSTSSVTATAGTYLLALWNKDATAGWTLAGTDPSLGYPNPAYVNVVAPPPPPDIYEVNNTAATAYNLSSTLTWVSNRAHTSTPGSNFHVATDEDYYKVVLPAGYYYVLRGIRVNDVVSHDDATTYTADAVWSYSTNGGTTWSTVYDDVMTTTPKYITTSGLTGGTIIFHVSRHYAGITGTYLFKVDTITRSLVVGVKELDPEAVRVFPNPASEEVTIDFSGAGVNAIAATLTDIQGKRVYSAELNQQVFSIPVNNFAPGMYFLQVSTEAGILNKKITVTSR